MNNQPSHSASNLTIDDLLRETFITVLQLRAGTATKEGSKLYQVAKSQIEHVQATLRKAKYSDAVIEDITYAQCALLDEAVMNRHLLNEDDNAYQTWVGMPLQIYFFNTLEAGEAIYQRIQTVLLQAAPNPLVLACFHRLLLLGFTGKYSAESHHSEREAIFKHLDALIQQYGHMPMHANQHVLLGVRKKPFWLLPKRIRAWAVLSMLAIGIWGLWHILDNQLTAQLAEAIGPQAVIIQQVPTANSAELIEPAEVSLTSASNKMFFEVNNKPSTDKISNDADLNLTQSNSVQQAHTTVIQATSSTQILAPTLKDGQKESMNSSFIPAQVVHPNPIGEARE